MAVVEPADVERFLEICERWDVEAVVVGEVDDTSPADHRVARRDRGRRTPAVGGARRPDLPAAVRPARLAGRAAGRRRRRRWPGRRPATSCARRCCGWWPRRTCATSPGSPTSTTATCRATPCSRSPRTPGWSGSTRTSGLGVAVSTDCNGRFALLDPYDGRPARARRVLPQRRDVRGPAARGQRLPQLRVARGPRRDVAVRGGHPRAGRRLPRARHPGDRRQRQPLQPDRRDRDPAHAGGGGARGDRRRGPAYAVRLRRGGPADLPARHHPRRARPARSGRTSCTGTSAACPPRVDLAAERQLADILVNASRDGLVDAAHDLSDGGLAQALVESCLRNGVGARVWLPDGIDPFVALFSESAGARDRRGAALGGGPVHRHVQRPRLPARSGSGSPTASARTPCSTCRACSRCRSRSSARRGPAPCPPPSADGSQPTGRGRLDAGQPRPVGSTSWSARPASVRGEPASSGRQTQRLATPVAARPWPRW